MTPFSAKVRMKFTGELQNVTIYTGGDGIEEGKARMEFIYDAFFHVTGEKEYRGM